MNITSFLHGKGFYHFEGCVQLNLQKVEDLIHIINLINKDKPTIHAMEIGFNAGHSAELFLQSNKDLILTSFDLGHHPYVLAAKEYIDLTYPKRHALILGDSRITVPLYNHTTFDIIFIDGGHEYETAKTDMENCLRLAHKDTIIILDDTIFTAGWEEHYTLGPSRTWIEYLQQDKIVEVERKDYSHGMGMVWGTPKYSSTLRKGWDKIPF